MKPPYVWWFYNNSTVKLPRQHLWRASSVPSAETVGKLLCGVLTGVKCWLPNGTERDNVILQIAGIVKEDEVPIAKAKAWTLKTVDVRSRRCDFRGYNDEAAFRVIAAMASSDHTLTSQMKSVSKFKMLIERPRRNHAPPESDGWSTEQPAKQPRCSLYLFLLSSQRVSRFITITRKQASTLPTH